LVSAIILLRFGGSCTSWDFPFSIRNNACPWPTNHSKVCGPGKSFRHKKKALGVFAYLTIRHMERSSTSQLSRRSVPSRRTAEGVVSLMGGGGGTMLERGWTKKGLTKLRSLFPSAALTTATRSRSPFHLFLPPPGRFPSKRSGTHLRDEP
jgi:hypothetical protein